MMMIELFSSFALYLNTTLSQAAI